MSEKQLASEILTGLQAAGFERGTARVSNDELHELQAENGDLNLFRTNFETEIGMSGILDQSRASLSINKIEKSVVGEAIDNLKLMALSGTPDPAFDIAGNQPAETFSAGPKQPDYELMYDRINEVEAHAKANYPILNLRSAGITYFKRQSAVLNTNGVEFQSVRGQYNVSVSFSSKQELATSSMMYTGFSSFDLDKPIHEYTNVDALFRQSTEQVLTEHLPGKFVGDMVIAPSCLPSFLGFLTARLGDAAMVSGTSVYKDKLGAEVASPLLNLHSQPVGGELCSGYWITGDGYKAENSVIVENGILKTYLLGIYGANKTGMNRAVNGGGCYVVAPGETSYEALIGQVENGILINRFSGGRPNDRGDFSGIAKNSYYVRDGKVQFPIKETTVSGNLIELLKSIQAISRECLNNGSSSYPWIRVGGITAS